MKITLEGDEAVRYLERVSLEEQINQLKEAVMGLKEDLLAKVAELKTRVDEVHQAEVDEDVVQEADRAALRARVAELEAQVAAGLSPEQAAEVMAEIDALKAQIADTPTA